MDLSIIHVKQVPRQRCQYCDERFTCEHGLCDRCQVCRMCSEELQKFSTLKEKSMTTIKVPIPEGSGGSKDSRSLEGKPIPVVKLTPAEVLMLEAIVIYKQPPSELRDSTLSDLMGRIEIALQEGK